MVTGRKCTGMAAMFGERVLARLPTTNGEDRFRPGIWLGKTDRADFHIVATVDGLRWTRTIKRLPIAYDAETLANARTWPWNVQNQRHCWQKFQVSHYHLTWLLQSVLRRDVKLLNVDANHLLYLHPFNKMVIKEELQGRQGMVTKRLQIPHLCHLLLRLQVAKHP